jgi:hypothetical protein
MDDDTKFLEFVNAQAAFHARKAREFSTSTPRRSEQHTRICEQFTELALFLTKQESEIAHLHAELATRPKISAPTQRQLSLRLDDLVDLPDALIQELSITDGDRMDFTIQALINEHGGAMSLDQLLIALFRKTGEVHKRANLNSRLYRMSTKGDLFSVPGKKGVYATRELTPEETKEMT